MTVIHLVGIPLDGTSVNPARSIGPALFEGGAALGHIWVFILAPLVGGALAAVVAPLLKATPQGISNNDARADQTGANMPRTRTARSRH
ncbi:aquaporin [Nakamurella sp. PAMC28650]|uniref:aquaporin n=1 Tax=Nakamurella sp. PAMC28650 TaxID=2762325 RepID=UPI00351BAC9B